ncbi:MAG: histidine phosphatase family protein [Acidimicrobiales bacterium]
MELLLIRHALPVRRENAGGPADPELSEAGAAQAELLAEYLAAEHLHAVYASPLQRARQTAAPLAQRKGVTVVIEDGVAEYDRHSDSYVPVEELKAANDPRWKEIVATGGQYDDISAEEFQALVVGSVEKLIAAHGGHKIAVVCHGGVINAYLAHVLRLADPTGFFYPNYTSIHRVAAARSGERSILTINETSHLRGSGLPVGLFQG